MQTIVMNEAWYTEIVLQRLHNCVTNVLRTLFEGDLTVQQEPRYEG